MHLLKLQYAFYKHLILYINGHHVVTAWERSCERSSSSTSSQWYNCCLHKCTTLGEKQPIRANRRVLALSINFMYVLLNVLLAEKQLTYYCIHELDWQHWSPPPGFDCICANDSRFIRGAQFFFFLTDFLSHFILSWYSESFKCKTNFFYISYILQL